MDNINVPIDPETKELLRRHCAQRGDTMAGNLRRYIHGTVPRPEGYEISLPGISPQDWDAFKMIAASNGKTAEEVISGWIRKAVWR